MNEYSFAISEPEPFQNPLLRKIVEFGNKDWIVTGLITQVILVVLMQLIIWLIPNETIKMPTLTAVTDLKFVEYQEITENQPTQVQDLSDKIIEKEKKDKLNPINWKNSQDPTMDFSQRYRPLFKFNNVNEYYPDSARRSNLGKVTVSFTMLVGTDGKVKDVRIRNIRSMGGGHKAFQKDFRQAVRLILLKKTRLLTKPYYVNGTAVPFTWDNKIIFTLQ